MRLYQTRWWDCNTPTDKIVTHQLMRLHTNWWDFNTPDDEILSKQMMGFKNNRWQNCNTQDGEIVWKCNTYDEEMSC